MGAISIGKLTSDNFHYKGFNEEGIKFELDFPIKYNLLSPPLKINNLDGYLYIINKKTKITSEDRVGEFICSDFIKLEFNKTKIIKLQVTLYYIDIFFSNILNNFDIEYKIDININGKCLFICIQNKHKHKNGKVNLISLLKKYFK